MCFIQIPLCLNPLSHILYTTLSKCSNKKLKKYKNGLTLAYYDMPELHSVSIGVFVNTGSVNETPKTNGLSHFIEHTMFKGTKRRTAFDIVADTDAMGANINAYTSKTATCYYIQCVDNDFENCADILSDIYFNSVFPADELEKEKGVILEEIAMCNDTPDDLSYEIASTAFYKGHPLARPILGSAKNVKSFTRDDVFRYMDERYTADNTVIAVAGNVCFEKVDEIVEKYFIGNFTRIKSKKRKIDVPETHSVYVKKFKKIEQSNINILFPSTSYNDETFNAVKIFNSAFGFGMSGRLYQHIRERLGLAYSVYSYLSAYKQAGHGMIYLGTNVQNVERALEAVRKEIEEVKRTGLTDDEFLRGKAQIKSAFVFGLETSIGNMNLLGKHALLTGEVADVEELIGKIDAVTPDDVRKAIDVNYDLSKATVGYVGPRIDKNLLDILKN